MVSGFLIALRRRPLVLARQLTLGLATLSLSAFGAEPSPQELALVRELWERAAAAQDRADWDACERALAEAVPIIETPGMRFHLAHCREMQSKWVEALVDYKLVEELLNSGVKADDVVELLPPAIERLEAKIPRLTLLVRPLPEQASLFIDGNQLSTNLIAKPIPLNPGSHIIELAASGFEPISRRISLLESEQRELELAFTRVQVAQGSSHSTLTHVAEPADTAFSAKPSVTAVQALAALGAGWVAAYHLVEAQDARLQRTGSAATLRDCDRGTLECSESAEGNLASQITQYQRERQEHETSAMIWGLASGVAATSLLVTWLLWPDPEPSDNSASGRGFGGQPSVTQGPARSLPTRSRWHAQWQPSSFGGVGKITVSAAF